MLKKAVDKLLIDYKINCDGKIIYTYDPNSITVEPEQGCEIAGLSAKGPLQRRSLF